MAHFYRKSRPRNQEERNLPLNGFSNFKPDDLIFVFAMNILSSKDKELW
jgi:hypothetical protein